LVRLRQSLSAQEVLRLEQRAARHLLALTHRQRAEEQVGARVLERAHRRLPEASVAREKAATEARLILWAARLSQDRGVEVAAPEHAVAVAAVGPHRQALALVALATSAS
jgi:hypothetical protein